MRKFMIIVLLLSISVLLVSGAVFASDDQHKNDNTFINIYQAGDSLAIGLKERILWNFYGSVNIEYFEARKDLKIQAGLVYRFPREVFFIKFHGGGGREYFRDHGFTYNYIVLGAHVFCFFGEIVYPWKDEAEPLYRYGLSFNF